MWVPTAAPDATPFTLRRLWLIPSAVCLYFGLFFFTDHYGNARNSVQEWWKRSEQVGSDKVMKHVAFMALWSRTVLHRLDGLVGPTLISFYTVWFALMSSVASVYLVIPVLTRVSDLGPSPYSQLEAVSNAMPFLAAALVPLLLRRPLSLLRTCIALAFLAVSVTHVYGWLLFFFFVVIAAAPTRPLDPLVGAVLVGIPLDLFVLWLTRRTLRTLSAGTPARRLLFSAFVAVACLVLMVAAECIHVEGYPTPLPVRLVAVPGAFDLAALFFLLSTIGALWAHKAFWPLAGNALQNLYELFPQKKTLVLAGVIFFGLAFPSVYSPLKDLFNALPGR